MLDQIVGAGTKATNLFFEVDHVSIDNATFKLFYKATTSVLLAFAFMTSSKQFFGDPIVCEVPGGGVNEGTLHAYCWMYAGFTFPPNFEGKCVKREHDGSNLYSSYYQWVGLFLIASALIFYVPRAIWLQFEGGLMKFLSKGATGKIVEDAGEKRESLVETFKEHLNNKYDKYAALFFICEQLNFVLVIMMWFVTNSFLKYQFIRYGPAVVHYYSLTAEEQKFETDPTCEIFPRIAMCNYKRYGSGGGQSNLEAICILGMNEINDVLFAALWFWYFFLTLFGVSRFMYRLCQLCSDRFRWYVMKVRISRYFKANKSTRYVERYVKTCSYGNWFVLYQMSRNMNRRFFAELLTVLSVQMVDKDELGSDECLIGDVLVKFKDMADGGLFLSKSHVQQLAKDGDLTMSRRGSTLLSAPSCISLNDKTMDILSDLGAPDGDKDEEEDNSEKSKGKNKESKKEPEKEEEKIEEQEEEEDNDAAEKLMKEEMIRKRKRGYHGDENDDDSEEEEVNDENNGKNIGFRRQQRTNEPKLSTTNKHSTCSQNPRSRKR